MPKRVKKAVAIKKQVGGWKNKSITMPMKNGRPYKKGDKPPYTYQKYNYKVKLSKKNIPPRGGAWVYDTVVLQKEPPKNHISEMIAVWSVFEVITPKNRWHYQRRK